MKFIRGARRILISSRLLLILLVVLEFMLLIKVNNFDYLYSPDATVYLRLGQEIRGGEFFQKDYDLDQGLAASRTVPFFYSSCLAGLSFISRNLVFAAHLFSILLTALMFLPLYGIARKLELERAGLLALPFLILNPFNILYGGAILTEPLFTLLFVAAALIGIYHLEKARIGISLGAGVLSGLAYITRENGLGVFALLLVFSPLYWRRVSNLQRKRIALLASGLVLGFMIVAFPYWLQIRIHTGKWSLTARMPADKIVSEQILSSRGEFDTDEVPGVIYLNPDHQPEKTKPLATAPEFARKIIVLSAKYLLQSAKRMGATVSLGIILYSYFFLAGLRRRAKEKLWLELYLFLGIGVYILILAVVTSHMLNSRYVYPILGLGMMLGSGGWLRLGEKLQRRLVSRGKAGGMVWVFLIPLLLVCYFLEFDSMFFREIRHLSPDSFYRSFEGGVREVVQQLKPKGLIKSPGKIFLDRKPFYAYYFDGLVKSLPPTYPDLKERLTAGEADYLVADSFALKKSRPLLIELVIGGQPPGDYKAYDAQDGKVLVLRDPAKVIASPVPGARIIYSRYLPRHRRIVTIYDLKPGKQEPQEQLSLEQAKKRALEAYEQGYLYDAINYARKGLAEKPDDGLLWKTLVNSHLIYFKVVDATPSNFIIDNFLLTELMGYTRSWLAIEPDNNEAKEILAYLGQMREKQQSFKAGVLRQFEK